jgi:murein DD-endopeptidase MepM/ murein hydrolase activator NlpD
MQSQNKLNARWAAMPGDTLYYPSNQVDSTVSGIAPSIVSVEINPLPLVQGKTIEIRVKTRSDVALSGSLLGHDLHFSPIGEHSSAALAGVYAMQNPGLYPIRLSGKQSDGNSFDFEQMILVDPGYYPDDPRLQVDPATIDPKTTQPEALQIAGITASFTPERYWDGAFVSPGYDPKWITSWFGNRRTYNEDPNVSFHAGVDYGGGIGLPIKAPAAGVVVFTGSLTVRGNATIIDHGWGVYTGYWHQSQIDVKVGDHVTPGQVIGLIGGTGRVTGAHLHWEVWVNGIQVDPLDWLDTVYP